MDYFVLKWIHIVSSTLLFGTGLGTVFYKCMADYYGNVEHQAPAILNLTFHPVFGLAGGIGSKLCSMNAISASQLSKHR